MRVEFRRREVHTLVIRAWMVVGMLPFLHRPAGSSRRLWLGALGSSREQGCSTDSGSKAVVPGVYCPKAVCPHSILPFYNGFRRFCEVLMVECLLRHEGENDDDTALGANCIEFVGQQGPL